MSDVVRLFFYLITISIDRSLIAQWVWHRPIDSHVMGSHLGTGSNPGVFLKALYVVLKLYACQSEPIGQSLLYQYGRSSKYIERKMITTLLCSIM